MKHGANVRHGQEIRDVVLAGFNIDFDLGEAGHVGKRLAIARVLILARLRPNLVPPTPRPTLWCILFTSSGASWPS